MEGEVGWCCTSDLAHSRPYGTPAKQAILETCWGIKERLWELFFCCRSGGDAGEFLRQVGGSVNPLRPARAERLPLLPPLRPRGPNRQQRVLQEPRPGRQSLQVSRPSGGGRGLCFPSVLSRMESKICLCGFLLSGILSAAFKEQWQCHEAPIETDAVPFRLFRARLWRLYHTLKQLVEETLNFLVL